MKRKIYIGTLLILLLALGGCGFFQDGEAAHEYDAGKVDGEFINGNNEFAWNIMKALNEEDEEENIFISPISISTALSMTYQGAREETKEEMAEVLGYGGMEDEVLRESYEEFLTYLAALDPDIELNIGNSIWYREGEAIEEDFLTINKDVFDASVEEIDFSDERAADIINDWIEGATEDGIRPGIFIEEVLHKAVIEVNEQGSEAAAVTVVVMEESAAMDPLSFIADRPFIFIIANDEADSILFMGKAAGWQ
jgi:serine protease inhibitor